MPGKLDLLRRTMAALLDIVIVFISGFIILTTVITPIYSATVPEFVTNQDNFRSLQIESYIYYEDDNQILVAYDFESFSTEQDAYDFSEAVFDYYSLFKNGKVYDNTTLPFEFSIAWFNQSILKVDDENSLFQLNSFSDLNVLATPKETTTNQQLQEFYFEAYRNANNDLLSYAPFRTLRDELNWVIIQILLISISIVVFGFYFLIPLRLGHGQTLMKRLFKIYVVSKQGFKLTHSELFLRSLGTWVSFVALAFSLEGTLLVVYAVMAFTPLNRAPHDFIAMTKVIDGRHVKVYKNQQEKEKFDQQTNVVENLSI